MNEHSHPRIFPQAPQAGVCLHFTSLPGQYGLGEIGRAAFDFIDTLVTMDLRVWQFLPTGPTGFGDSPYQSLSTFAGNELLIDTQALLDSGLLKPGEPAGLRRLPAGSVDFASVIPLKTALLRLAAERFDKSADAAARAAFDNFLHQNNDQWLHDYAVFRAIKHHRGEQSWFEWDADLRRRTSRAVSQFEARAAAAIHRIKILQFLFFQQWRALQAHARRRGILLFGDIPIYLALDSADVWADPALVDLNADFSPRRVGGVPPDSYSTDGQLWGNPLYNWQRHAETGYGWWVRRLGHNLESVDLVRLDHFRGLEAYWSIPEGSENARIGEWVDGPGYNLLDTFFDAFDAPQLVAEDLGFMTRKVHTLRDHYAIPGMEVLQERFNDGRLDFDGIHPNSVCYPATHDNDTSRGWFNGSPCDLRSPEKIRQTRQRVLAHTGMAEDRVVEGLIRLAFGTPANLAIALMQDFLDLGSEARLNHPGTASNNWRWRLLPEQLGGAMIDKVQALVSEAGRRRRAWGKAA